MSCGSYANRYFLLADGIGGLVLLCHSFEKPVGFFSLPVVSASLSGCGSLSCIFQ